MREQTLGKKPQRKWKLVRNNETTLTIKKGAPCVLDSNDTTRMGWGVKSIESLAAAEEHLFFGLATADIAPGATSGQQGQTVFGHYDQCRVITGSRSASTAVWVSTVALALGDILDFNTTAGLQAFSRVGAGSAQSVYCGRVRMMQTLVSQTTQASSITANADSSLLYSISKLNVFVEFM